jgi:deoxyribonuclease IV
MARPGPAPKKAATKTAKPAPRFGAHMSIAGGHDLGIRAAHRFGFASVQLFTKSTNQWKAKALSDESLAAVRQALAETSVAAPVGHNSYLINLGSPDEFLWNRSIEALVLEVERAEALGMTDLVIHPGAHVGAGERRGIARIAKGLKVVLKRTRGVALILDKVDAPERLGVCADTCHLFASGYPLGTPEEYNETIDAMNRAFGLARLRVWHVNDSVRECGSRVDRHAGIGRGKMGLAPFSLLVNDARFAALPLILETPKGTEGDEELDAINLRVLRQLWQGSDGPASPAPRIPASKRRRRS